jgi:hypothetical protein
MYPSVLAAFPSFTKSLEGWKLHLYLDLLGYLTTGCGNLADGVSLALTMPWIHANGTPAYAPDVIAAWDAVDKQRTAPKGQKQGGMALRGADAFASLTTIRLTEASVVAMVQRQLAADEAELREHFTAWDTLPADGQLCCLSMCWAMGSGFPSKFPQFTSAVNIADWSTALAECEFQGTGVAPRIAANKVMLANAADVAAHGLDTSVLYYPEAAA